MAIAYIGLRGFDRRDGSGIVITASQILRVARVLGIVVLALVMVPIVMVPVYWVVNPISVPMASRYISFKPVTRVWRPIDEISDRLKASVLMSEDGQFCRHWGVDLGALRAEINNWRAGREPRGASTISMQVARNLFLWNGRSYVRKALEIPIAGYLDLILSKKRIMEIYLNIAEWGPSGQFGIEAGALHAFGTDADAFSWQNAAMMAVILPNPQLRNPVRPTRGLQRVAGIVSRRAQKSQAYIGCLYNSGMVALQ